MKFAIVNGQRTEAQTGLSGECPGCKAPVLAICGDVRIWHWRHISKRMCDSWWENETEWHRAWKEHFPTEWQEFHHIAQDGERHIADVKTDEGWVLEFQHSHLAPEERQARNDFYPKLIWVVDGLRRKRDWDQFLKTVEGKPAIFPKVPMCCVFPTDCALFQEWTNSRSPVFFDFGPDRPLGCLLPGLHDGMVYVGPLQRQTFLDFHKPKAIQSGQDFTGLLNHLNEIIPLHVEHRRNLAQRELVGRNRFDPLQIQRRRSRRF